MRCFGTAPIPDHEAALAQAARQERDVHSTMRVRIAQVKDFLDPMRSFELCHEICDVVSASGTSIAFTEQQRMRTTLSMPRL